VGDEKVTVMDINEESGLLLCGYYDGGIALWDLLEYKLLKYLPQMHGSSITNIKIDHVSNNGNVIHGVSCELNGPVRWFEITKRALFGGFNYTSEYLFKTKMTGTSAIAVYKPYSIYPH
jgi:hypothetical protein